MTYKSSDPTLIWEIKITKARSYILNALGILQVSLSLLICKKHLYLCFEYYFLQVATILPRCNCMSYPSAFLWLLKRFWITHYWEELKGQCSQVDDLLVLMNSFQSALDFRHFVDHSLLLLAELIGRHLYESVRNLTGSLGSFEICNYLKLSKQHPLS